MLTPLCEKYGKMDDPISVRFYSVDIDVEENQAIQARYTNATVPHLYIFLGTEEKLHVNDAMEPDYWEKGDSGAD